MEQRPPRFALTYPVETGDSVEERELPFVIGVLAELSADPGTSLLGRQFLEIDRDNFDAVRAAHRPPTKLEGVWQGLRWLVSRAATSPLVKIRVLNVGKKRLLRDLQRAPCFDQSFIFKKVHDDIYGAAGAEPFSVLVGAYDFSQEPDDMELLEQMARVAETARAPFLSAAGPRMFGREDFAELAGLSSAAVRDVVVHAEDNSRWRAFQQSPVARYVCLAWPGFLLPPPHGSELWGNPAFVLAATLASAFCRDGLCIDISGEESGGRIEGLPIDRPAGTGPTELCYDDDFEYMWGRSRFLCLTGIRRLGVAVIFSAPTCHWPPPVENLAAFATACLSAALPLVMIESRFAQYVKALVRDRHDRFESPGQCERFLNDWIARYIDETEQPPLPPVHPLQEARIEVREAPGTPGAYEAVMQFRPQWWDGMPGPMRVVLPFFLKLSGNS